MALTSNLGVGPGLSNTAVGISSVGSESRSGNANFFQGLANQFTGNLDWQRNQELLRRQQHFNALEAQKSRNWSERMANTQYQRAVKDLRAAGLNPALAIGAQDAVPSSAMASSGSGAGSQGSGIGFSHLFNSIASLAGNAIQVGLMLKGVPTSHFGFGR